MPSSPARERSSWPSTENSASSICHWWVSRPRAASFLCLRSIPLLYASASTWLSLLVTIQASCVVIRYRCATPGWAALESRLSLSVSPRLCAPSMMRPLQNVRCHVVGVWMRCTLCNIATINGACGSRHTASYLGFLSTQSLKVAFPHRGRWLGVAPCPTQNAISDASRQELSSKLVCSH